MKLCIPPLGALIRLTQPWEFRLYFEGRNATLLAAALDGSKKIKIPWAHALEYLEDKSKKSDFLERDAQAWKALLADFKAAGFKVQYKKKLPGPSDEVYKSYKTQIPLPYILWTMPDKTILAFDRYYIRQGAEAFNSVTFKIERAEDPRLSSKPVRRFWARLQDVNQIECEILG